METNGEPLSSHVAETINRLGYSKNQISKLAGVPYATLDRKLNGHSDFTVVELGRIARVLDLTVGDLIPAEILGAAA